jgi:DNA-binding transcriptional MerR regulator
MPRAERLLEKIVNSHAASQVSGGADDKFYSIGELSQLLCIEATAIRFYERCGLLAPGRLGKLRIYRKSDAERAATIVFLRSTGMTIAKIGEMLAASDQQSETSDSALPITRMLEDQLTAMQHQAEQMTQKIAALSEAITLSSTEIVPQ